MDPPTDPPRRPALSSARCLLSENEREEWAFLYYCGLGKRRFLAGSEAYKFFYDPQAIEIDIAQRWVYKGRPTRKHLFWIDEAHPIAQIWENDLAPKVLNTISRLIQCGACVDVVRIGKDLANAQNIIWIGVTGDEVDEATALQIVLGVELCLESFGVSDFTTEVHKMSVSLLALLDTRASEMLNPGAWPLRAILEPVSTTVGMKTCVLNAESTEIIPDRRGSGGFFFTDAQYSDLYFLFTCQHVLAGPDNPETSVCRPPPNATLADLGDDGSLRPGIVVPDDEVLSDIIREVQSREDGLLDGYQEGRLSANMPWLPRAPLWVHELRRFFQSQLAKVVKMQSLQHRTVGRVFGFPSISELDGASSPHNKYTRDIGIIALDRASFEGHALNWIDADLHTRNIFIEKMKRLVLKPEHGANALGNRDDEPQRNIFSPDNRIALRGIMRPEEYKEKRLVFFRGGKSGHPVALEQPSRGLTAGMASPIASYVMHRPHGEGWTKQWPIRAIDTEEATMSHFSVRGDSGAVVFDAQGRMGGVIHSGGLPVAPDAHPITYCTPMFEVLSQLREWGMRPDIVESDPF